jgi:hypothetical protein
VFDTQYGFGGNGLPDTKMTGKGDYIMEGPMAGMNFRYFKDRIDPHCLFRTFDYSKNRLSGGKYSSSAIDEILKKPDISSFTKSLNSVHASVHAGLGGDMEGFSAPNGELHFPMYSLKLSSTCRPHFLPPSCTS